MTYNILFGGQPLDFLFEIYRRDRIPELLDVIRAVDPDILGIQEAWSWNTDDYPAVSAIADELGMNYVITPSHSEESEPQRLCIVVFTKHEIIEYEGWLDDYVHPSLRTAIRLPSGSVLQVFNAHLTGNLDGVNSEWVRLQEAKHLIAEMTPYFDQPCILIGDLNFPASQLLRCTEHPAACGGPAMRMKPGELLQENNWTLVAYEDWLGGLEQIWVNPSLLPQTAEVDVGVERDDLYTLSDHLPIVVKITIE